MQLHHVQQVQCDDNDVWQRDCMVLAGPLQDLQAERQQQ